VTSQKFPIPGARRPTSCFLEKGATRRSPRLFFEKEGKGGKKASEKDISFLWGKTKERGKRSVHEVVLQPLRREEGREVKS